MRILVYDFEVFQYDTLLGVIILEKGKTPLTYQTWDLNEIKRFYKENINSVWVGHNNEDYDNLILQAVIQDKNVYKVSNDLINKTKRYYLNIQLYYYDIIGLHFTGLKVIEAAVGKNISETQVDFDLDRPLTAEEKRRTESYNRDDLNQTYENLLMIKSEFMLRFDLMKEFKLSLDTLHYTQAQIAAAVLKAKRIDNIELLPYKPIMYPQLRVKNPVALDYYLNERWKEDAKPVLELCGVKHNLGIGGMHGAREKCSYDWAYYFDVSGYYNLVMINYDLLSRTIPEEGKALYEHMYHEQLRLKKIDPVKRQVYKVILLAVFGAQKHAGSDFYDINKGTLVPIVGEMFLIDLLEKLEGKVELIQSNTDGIIAKPLENVREEDVVSIIKEWQDRTGFTLKLDKIYNIVQRDVNNYMYRDDKGNIHVKGEAVKYYNNWQNPLSANCFNSKEPLIVHQAIVEYYMNGKSPEDTVREFKDELRLFQYILKVMTYDYLTFESPTGVEKLQKVNRCFASKRPGMVYKNKANKHDRYSNLPDSVFVHNDDLKSVNKDMIDYDYYVRRIYERIAEFKKDYEQLSLFL